jgi:hypothetical protein
MIAGPITGDEILAIVKRHADPEEIYVRAALDVDSDRLHEELDAATASALHAVMSTLEDDASNLTEVVAGQLRAQFILGLALAYHVIADRDAAALEGKDRA